MLDTIKPGAEIRQKISAIDLPIKILANKEREDPTLWVEELKYRPVLLTELYEPTLLVGPLALEEHNNADTRDCDNQISLTEASSLYVLVNKPLSGSELIISDPQSAEQTMPEVR